MVGVMFHGKQIGRGMLLLIPFSYIVYIQLATRLKRVIKVMGLMVVS